MGSLRLGSCFSAPLGPGGGGECVPSEGDVAAGCGRAEKEGQSFIVRVLWLLLVA